MNILKTAKILIILLFVLLSVSFVVYFTPFKEIVSSLPYINTLYNNTSLTVSSRNGNSKVKIDGKEYGETPLNINDLKPGEYNISLTRVSEFTDFYKERNLSIEIENGTEAIVDLEIGPDEVTHGYYLYYKKSPSIDNKGYLTINSHTGVVNVILDEEYLNISPITTQILTTKEYQIKIKKDGYEELSFPIIIREGYNLNCNVYLMRKPIEINTINE